MTAPAGWRVDKDQAGTLLRRKDDVIPLNRVWAGLTWPTRNKDGALVLTGQTEEGRIYVIRADRFGGLKELTPILSSYRRIFHACATIYPGKDDSIQNQDAFNAAEGMDVPDWVPVPGVEQEYAYDVVRSFLEGRDLRLHASLKELAGEISRIELDPEYQTVIQETRTGDLQLVRALGNVCSAFHAYQQEGVVETGELPVRDPWTGI